MYVLKSFFIVFCGLGIVIVWISKTMFRYNLADFLSWITSRIVRGKMELATFFGVQKAETGLTRKSKLNKRSVLRRQSRDTNRNIKRSVYCQYGWYSLTFRALALRQRETVSIKASFAKM